MQEDGRVMELEETRDDSCVEEELFEEALEYFGKSHLLWFV